MTTLGDLEYEGLASLPIGDVDASVLRIRTLLGELNSRMDVRRGVIRDLLIEPHASLETQLRLLLVRVQQSSSLLEIEANPEIATDTIVDRVLSNWGVTRSTGSKASGTITVELTSARSIVVTQGTSFEASGLSFLTTATITSRLTAETVTSTGDRLLVAMTNGNYAFTIPVEASAVGSEYLLRKDDALSPALAIPSYSTSYATSTFISGSDVETNTDLLAKLRLGIAPGVPSHRLGMINFLNNQSSLSQYNMRHSIVGHGDTAQLRDKHGILPVSTGKVDWYIRTQELAQSTQITVSATLQELSDDNYGIWKVTVTGADAAGVYDIQRVLPEGFSPGDVEAIRVEETLRGAYLSGTEYEPEISTAPEAAFTAFQSLTVTFMDASAAETAAAGTKKNFLLELRKLPGISEAQAIVSTRENRYHGGDVLVKAPIPCFVTVSMTINKFASDSLDQISTIQSLVAAEINATGFIGRLDASRLLDKVHDQLSDQFSVTGFAMLGQLLQPNGIKLSLYGQETLQTPDDPANMITADTVQFFAAASDITVATADTLPTSI